MSVISVIEPKRLVRAKLRVANGIAQMRANEPFWVLVSIFAEADHLLPKNMIIGTASKSALQVTELPGVMGREIAQFLSIRPPGVDSVRKELEEENPPTKVTLNSD